MMMQNRTFYSAAAATLLLIAGLSGAALAETPAPADVAPDEAFLDILPKIDLPEVVQPIPGAVNEEFRNCRASWPAEYEQAQSGPEARALRDIYSLVRARNVIATGDCGCTGKVASWTDVESIASALRNHANTLKLGWQETQAISAEAKTLIAVTETMCGGSF
jgi:hypothetical protein